MVRLYNWFLQSEEWYIKIDMGVSIKGGSPIAGCFMSKTPIEMDDLRIPPFMETPHIQSFPLRLIREPSTFCCPTQATIWAMFRGDLSVERRDLCLNKSGFMSKNVRICEDKPNSTNRCDQKWGIPAKNGYLNGEDPHFPVDLGVPYFQANWFGRSTHHPILRDHCLPWYQMSWYTLHGNRGSHCWHRG